jgi:hypothetical protein
MKNGSIVEIVVKGFVYLLIQFFVLSEIPPLFGAAQAWIYIALIITLPANISKIQLLFIALFYGIIVDVFNDTLGMHAACAVLVAFSKPFFLKVFASQTPTSSNTDTETLTIRTNGLSWFLMYAGSLVFIYQFAFYFIDSTGFAWFGFTVKRIVLSTIFTLIVMVILQYIIYPSRSRK